MEHKISYTALLCCAGSSTRYKGEKLLEIVNSKYLFEYSLKPFLNDLDCKHIRLIIPSRWHIGLFLHLLKTPKIDFVYGGPTRFLSIKHGLKEINTKYVVIHDGSRPFISIKILNLIKNNIFIYLKKQKTFGIALYKNIESLVINKKFIPIKGVKVIETPQAFFTKELKQVYNNASYEEYRDSSLVYLEQHKKIFYLENPYINFKITYANEFEQYKSFLKIINN